MLVALDGGSGSGKSTFARWIADDHDATIVHGDDFFATGISDADWDSRSPEQRVADAIDWRRLRHGVLVPLLAGKAASYHPFEFEAGVDAQGAYALANRLVTLRPAPVIVLEGAYSSRPELSDLIELAVLLDVPQAVRHGRLADREEAAFLEAWHDRRDAAEEHYLRRVRPPSGFDLVVKFDS
jgi:uridine kinase